MSSCDAQGIYPTVGSCNGLGLAQLDSTYIRVSSASCMDCIELDKRVGEGRVPGNAKEDVKAVD